MLYSIVTADATELESGELGDYMESVKLQNIVVVLVLRDVSEKIPIHAIELNSNIHVIHIGRAGISEVRNVGLLYLDKVGLNEDDYISFPDDDCVYPLDLDKRLSEIVDTSSAELIVGSYGESPAPLGKFSFSKLTRNVASYSASSVTLFVRWSLVKEVGGFNEALGVGSGNFNYGEDNDYCYRLLVRSKSSIYCPSIRIWHLEVRHTEGRNPKGYLSVCLIDLDIYRLFRVLIPSILAGLVRDILALDLEFQHLRNVKDSLNRRYISAARAGRYRAENLFLNSH